MSYLSWAGWLIAVLAGGAFGSMAVEFATPGPDLFWLAISATSLVTLVLFFFAELAENIIDAQQKKRLEQDKLAVPRKNN